MAYFPSVIHILSCGDFAISKNTFMFSDHVDNNPFKHELCSSPCWSSKYKICVGHIRHTSVHSSFSIKISGGCPLGALNTQIDVNHQHHAIQTTLSLMDGSFVERESKCNQEKQ